MSGGTYTATLGAIAGTVAIGLLFPGRALLPALLFWSAVTQGTLALAAAAELTRARWIEPIRATLLGVHPFLLAFPVAFLIFGRETDAYTWAAQPHGWLSPTFFITRSIALLLLTWWVGARFARASLRRAERAPTWAGLYALLFVLTQSLIAFDWVMSFEYPWVSTLFGGYFFVEALYAGIAVTAIVAARQPLSSGRHALRDAATLLFGFSLLWAGQFFAQYLVIWYGNLPHEVAFLARRITTTPLREASTLVLALLFGVPFLILLSRSAKTNPRLVTALAILVLIGILLERLVFLLPVLDLPRLGSLLAFLVLGAGFVLALRATPPPP